MKNFMYLWALAALSLLFSCQSDDATATTQEFEPGKAIVALRNGTTTTQLFAFINATGLQVDYITYMKYKSGLAASQLDYAKEYFNGRPYISENWGVYGFIDGQDNKIKLMPRLFGMHNIAFQNDLLQTMGTLQLTEENGATGPGLVLTVPVGQELQWVSTFEQMDIVEWAQPNYYAYVMPQ